MFVCVGAWVAAFAKTVAHRMRKPAADPPAPPCAAGALPKRPAKRTASAAACDGPRFQELLAEVLAVTHG